MRTLAPSAVALATSSFPTQCDPAELFLTYREVLFKKFPICQKHRGIIFAPIIPIFVLKAYETATYVKYVTANNATATTSRIIP